MDILTMLKKQAEQVEVFNLENEKTTVEFEANQLKACAVTSTKGTAVRVIQSERRARKLLETRIAAAEAALKAPDAS